MQRRLSIFNPYSGKQVAAVPLSGPGGMERALSRAREGRADQSPDRRVAVLGRLADLLDDRRDELSRVITSESGLCLRDTRHEVRRVAEVARAAALVAQTIDEDQTSRFVLGAKRRGPKLRVITEPLDLVVGITPFNHPMNQVAHKVLPAVAAGAPIVVKPSSKTPLSAFALQRLLVEAGLDESQVQIVVGLSAEKAVDPLITSPLVDMVTFTGGTEAGRRIASRLVHSGNTWKRFVPELGGCSSLIVNDDADVQRSVETAIKGCFGNSGQRCTAIRRVIVTRPIHKAFLVALEAAASKLKYGDPWDENVHVGTVISERSARSIQARVNAALRDGARLLVGNVRQGALYSPTVLDNVRVTSTLVAQETFGPVAAVIRARDIDHAISLARRTNYALAGAVMTRSEETARRVSNALVVGQFNWNGIPSYRTEAAPFGGFKDSGNGEKEGVILAAQGMRRIRTFYSH